MFSLNAVAELKLMLETQTIITQLCLKASSYNGQDKRAGRLLYNDKYDTYTSEILTGKAIQDIICEQGLLCHYCKIVCEIIPKKRRAHNLFTLDRIDNRLTHKKGNLLVCCYRCNTTRSNDFTSEDFKRIKQRVL